MNTKLKSLGSVLIATGLFFALTTANAQNKQQHTKPTATEQADKEVARLKTDLTLTADQEAKVKPIVQKYAEQKDAAFTASNGDRAAAKTKIDAIETSKDAELKTVLTDEQYQKLQTQKAAHKDHGGGEHGGGNGGGEHHKKQN